MLPHRRCVVNHPKADTIPESLHVGLSAVVVCVGGDAAPGGGGGAAGAQGAAAAERAEAGRCGGDGFGVPGGAGHGLCVGVDGEVVSGEAPCDARLGVDGLMAVS